MEGNNQMKYPKILITPEMKIKAREMAEEFHELDKVKNKHVFRSEKPDVQKSRKYFGYLGELAFEQYLKTKELEYKTDHVVGRKDLYDFEIQGAKFDVKTGTYIVENQYDGSFINKTQAEAHQKPDYYVFVTIKREHAIIRGVIRSTIVSKVCGIVEDISSPAYLVQLTDMTPVNKFFK